MRTTAFDIEIEAKFYYVYILIDTATETHNYIGFTQDLSARLAKHNTG